MRRIALLVIIASAIYVPAVSAKIGGGEITFKVDGAGDVSFSHEHHVTRKGLRCSECHNKVFTPNASIFSATMDEIRKGHACGYCHNGTRAFGVEGNCARCHH